uniref:CSON011576 protein n=1 Tax=Culicoides sonorensis TaxID=179676 RepID=A0A336KU34_CULSO
MILISAFFLVIIIIFFCFYLQSQSDTSPNSKAVNKERRWLLLSKRNKRRQSKADKKVEVQVDGKPLNVTVCDTAGQDVLDPLRQLCYPNTDVFLLCFSVVKPDTFKSIETKWVPELSKNNCSLLLIGTHSDLRDDAKTIQALQASGEKPISVSDAWDLARRIGAKYFETSVYNKEKIKEVFDTVIWDALQAQRKRPPLWKRLLCLT